jgi:hypothetical protein
MKAESVRPATIQTCNGVLAALADLTASGFDTYYATRHQQRNARRVHHGLPPEVRGEPTPITEPDVRKQISSARLFLRENCRHTKAIHRTIGSYGLKHRAERWAGAYISNGAFIAAAHIEGYRIERDGPNAYFSLTFAVHHRQ